MFDHPGALGLLLSALATAVFLAVVVARDIIAESKRKAARRIAARDAEFVRLFPGRCPVCSYHRYGDNHGFKGPPPGPHACPERLARLRGEGD